MHKRRHSFFTMQVFVCLFLKQSDFTLWVIGKSRHVDRYRGHLMGAWRDMSMSFAMDIFFHYIYLSIFWIDFVTYWNTLSLSFNIYIDWIFWYEKGVNITLDLHPRITDKIEKINLWSKERMQEVNRETIRKEQDPFS